MKEKDAESFEDLLNTGAVKDWLFRAEREMFPKMKQSVCSLVIAAHEPDAKLALEIGAAILFDKPLIIIVPPGATVPPVLARIATSIVEIDDMAAPESQQKIRDALEPVLKRASHR